MSQRKNIILKKEKVRVLYTFKKEKKATHWHNIYFLEFSHFRADKTLIFLYDLSLLDCLASDKT